MSSYLKNTILIIIIAVIALMGGMYFGETSGLYLFSQRPAAKTCPVCPAKTNGVTCPTCPTCPTAKETKTVSSNCSEKLIELGLMSKTVNTLPNATVKSINGSSLTVEINASDVDILKTGVLTKTVKIPSGVVIEEHTPKSPEETKKLTAKFETEAKALMARSEKGEDVSKEIASLTQPILYDVKNLKPSDLKAGDVISVTSDSDMRKANTFDAKSVILLSRAVVQSTSETNTTSDSFTTQGSANSSTTSSSE